LPIAFHQLLIPTGQNYGRTKRTAHQEKKQQQQNARKRIRMARAGRSDPARYQSSKRRQKTQLPRHSHYGNERGQVGVGVGKASDVIGAVKKGVADGKKHLIEVPLTKANSIPHPINGDGGGAKVMMRPAAPGTGVIAGGAVRTVLELAGVRNILAKQLGSGNPLNNARAAVNALSTLRTLSEVAQERGIPVENLYG